MTAINFPSSPAVNDEFTAGTTIYRWTGTVWEVKQSTLSSSSFSDSNPLMNGSAAAGTSGLASRSDHVHPSDTSKASITHASSHGSAGSDAITIAQSQVTNLTTDLSNKVDKTIVDAKGDLLVGSADNTVARQVVGNNGETLISDSTTSTGLRWQNSQITTNYAINGAFDFWQRGVGPTAVGVNTYLADRWSGNRGSYVAGSTMSRQTTGDTTNLPNIRYCLRMQRDSGNTATDSISILQSMESNLIWPLIGQRVILSFWARKGADYSSANSRLSSVIYSGTGIDQHLNSYTGTSIVADASSILTNTWQRFYISGVVSSSATELAIAFSYTPSGTSSTNDYFEVTGIQLELGHVPTPFIRSGSTLAGELSLCQRYYYVAAEGTAKSVAVGTYLSTTQVDFVLNFPTSMRTAPSLSVATGTNFYIAATATLIDDTFNALTIYQPTVNGSEIYATSADGVSATAGYGAILRTNNAASSIAFSAEL